ncbi:MAG TPA: MauE/DoxX family redox-associated membrane protein [Tepidisphaeraceae bacterium]|nr:MauE/DoxX family redox-associated membrane protein [Tepidisphaeraceae bacterium]
MPRFLAIAVGLLLLASGVMKLIAPFEFLRAILDYDLFGQLISTALAFIVPWIEIALAICLIAKWHQRTIAICTTILGIAFVALQLSAIARGLDIACGCLPTKDSNFDKIGWRSIGRAAIVALVGLFLWFETYSNTEPRPADDQPDRDRE